MCHNLFFTCTVSVTFFGKMDMDAFLLKGQKNVYTGLLIFREVAEPRISTKSAKSREIHQNTRNPTKFARNLTKYMSAQYI